MTSKVFLNTVLTISSLAATAAAQSPPPPDPASDKVLYILAFISIVGVLLSYYFWRRSKLGNQPDLSYGNRYQDYHSKATKPGTSVDADQELEWLRKVKSTSTKPDPTMTFKKRANTPRRRTEITATNSAGIDESTLDSKVFQEKMLRVQYAQLPINSFHELAPAKKYEPLPISEDEALLDAIEQANEEFEEDVAVRELALKILAMFRNKNSIEALSQIALYDLAAPLRSKAVTALTEFDHESVFEAILLACADPTREVRAAAARGLFRLDFDRADAWKRIIETRDGFRMRHAARAALEAGIVAKAFDRLIHDDMKIAYEAIVLVSLMIMAGETKEIFDAIRNHKDERVRFALVHVLKMIHDERTQEDFLQLAADESLSSEVKARVNEALPVFEAVAA